MPVATCTATTPPIDLDVHRRIRLRRLGLHGAVARAVADLAYGESRDAVVLVAVPSFVVGDRR